MKAPFGLEETRSRRHIHFPRFSILNQFSPAEDHGVFLTGRKGGFEYGAALINGSSGADQDDGKDLALRGMWHFGDLDTPGGRRFQIGLAGTAGRQEFSVAGDGFKNAGGARMLELAAGANLDGARTRVGLELAGMQGPWMFQGELLTMDQEMLSGAVEARGTVEGGYFELARALGGEDLDFGGVANPHDSWVAALRVSSLDFGGALADPMFVAAGMSPGRVDSVSLGLSHIPGAHTIWRGALAMSSYDDDIVVGSTSLSEETVLTVELQLHF